MEQQTEFLIVHNNRMRSHWTTTAQITEKRVSFDDDNPNVKFKRMTLYRHVELPEVYIKKMVFTCHNSICCKTCSCCCRLHPSLRPGAQRIRWSPDLHDGRKSNNQTFINWMSRNVARCWMLGDTILGDGEGDPTGTLYHPDLFRIVVLSVQGVWWFLCWAERYWYTYK